MAPTESEQTESNIRGRRLHRRAAAVALVLLAFGAAAVPGVAGQAVEPRAPVERTEFGGRAHIQLNTTSVDDAPGSEFRVRRARIWAATRINDWLDGVVLVDLAGGSASARYAFVRASLHPALRLSVGQFKRAFDLFELTSSSDMLLVERDGIIRGPAVCPGVGGQCTYSRFSERLALSSLDIGVLMQGEAAAGRLDWLVSLTNGSGPNTREDNDTKSLAARVTLEPIDAVVLGANVNAHDFTNPVTGVDEHAPSYAVDLEIGAFMRPGLHLQAAVLGGDNWRLLDPDGNPRRYLTAQTLLSYHVPTGGSGRIHAIEPLGRVSWGDPDRSDRSGEGVLLTPGLAVHFDRKNKVIGNVDVWRPSEGPTAWSLKATALVYF